MPSSKSSKAQKVTISHIKKGKHTGDDWREEESKGVQVSFTWSAAERIWVPKTKVWYLSCAAVALALILFSILSRYPSYQFIILGILAIVGLLFAQAAIPPHVLEHKVTSKGIYTYDGLYTWKEIGRFWFAVKKGQYLLHLDFPPVLRQPRITLLVEKKYMQRIFDLLIDHVNYGTPVEIEYNVFTKTLYGEYLPISHFIPDLDMPDEEETEKYK